MSIGKLKFQLYFGQEVSPVTDAQILIIDSDLGEPHIEGVISVDSSGKSSEIELYTYEKELSETPTPGLSPYKTYDAYIYSDTFDNVLIKNIEIFADTTSIQQVLMQPKRRSRDAINVIDVGEHGLLQSTEKVNDESGTNNQSSPFILKKPVIPENITVHLGSPSSNAQNVTVPFTDYIKNVASSEIYPTWPENAIRSNIIAQISFTLNRIYTEWYRSRGYNFDITNSTAYDHYFVNGRTIFENISRIVDEIFNEYISKQDFQEPLLAQYCNGTTVTCSGLSQWGTVDLANAGLSPYEILSRYYGNDIELRQTTLVDGVPTSYPGTPLKLGNNSEDVKTIQNQLNRIRKNYPAIPEISPVNGEFNTVTEQAVKKFQEIFNLTADGVVGKSTWYKLSQIYVGVKNLAELNSEGEKLPIPPKPPSYTLKKGSKGDAVKVLQYFLDCISLFFEEIPAIKIDGMFGTATENSVKSFQKRFNLEVDGIVGQATWKKLYEVYKAIEPYLFNTVAPKYPGYIISEGSRGEYVTMIQQWLSKISTKYASIPKVDVDGIFGPKTKNAVIAFQKQFSLSADGLVGNKTWDKLYSVYSTI